MSKWSTATLRGKIHVKHGWPFKSEFFGKSGKYVVLTPGNFLEAGGFKRNQAKDKCYSEAFPPEYLLKKGDVLVAMTEQAEGLLGSTAIVPEDGKFLHNQRLGLITPISGRMNPEFLYHLFKTRKVREQISLSSTGSKVKHTSPERIYDVLVQLPPPKDQKGIAAVLTVLEAKIELNHRINAELEGMAKLLYDYWFVQFEFPLSAAQAKALGNPRLTGKPYKSSGGKMTHAPDLKREIPDGWKVGKMGDIAENVRDGTHPKDAEQETPYVGLEHIDRQNFSLWSWGQASDVDSQKSKFKAGDFLFGKLRPYFHKVCLTPFDGICSTDILVIRAKHPNYRGLVGCQIFETDFVEYTTKLSAGTQMPRANWKAMSDYSIAIPDTATLEAFEKIIQPIRSLCGNSVLQNQELTTLRDWLLPLLMNGQVTAR